jgi:hypothetical protein
LAFGGIVAVVEGGRESMEGKTPICVYLLSFIFHIIVVMSN